MTEIESLSAPFGPALAGLGRLLVDTVAGGASVGFHAPVPEAEARAYWHQVEQAMLAGEKILLVARDESGIIGAVQLAIEPRANGIHRAEVQKLMVHPAARNRGLGRKLMAAIEAAAERRGRTLLVLDTRTGDVAEGLYKRLGYTHVGVIPGYTIDTGGTLSDTTYFYKQLSDQ